MQHTAKITYKLSENEWAGYSEYIRSLVELYSPTTVCDVGGGANPALSLEFIRQRGIEYTLLDISEAELAKAPGHYQKIVQDIEADELPWEGRFDFLFTKMLAEHLHDGRKFHRNVFRLLKPGGLAVHYFPTLYALPFIVNKLIPEAVSSALLDLFAPRERVQLGKFPAHYSWCYGPTPRMLSMLAGTGFEILEFRGLIGHIYYDRLPLIKELHTGYSRWLANHPSPYLTSFAQVILRKPAST